MASRCSRLYIGRLLHYEKCTAKTRLFSTGIERKRRVMSKEDRAEAVNSFVKQYMLQFPGKFPTFTLVMKEVGGSADFLRKILAELKISLKTSQDQKKNADVDEGAHEAEKSVAPENYSTDAELNTATSMEINSLKRKVLLSSDNISGIDTAVSQQETLSQSTKNESVAQSFSDQSSPPLLLEKLCTDVNDGAQEAAKSEAPENLSTDTKSNDATDLKIDSLKQKASLSLDNISGNDVPAQSFSDQSSPPLLLEKLCTDVNDGAQEAAKSEAPENLSTDTKSNGATDLKIDSLKQKASLSFDNISGNDVPKNQNKTLSQLIKKRMESFSDVNDGAQEAAKSIAPENLLTDTKSNGATDLKIDSLKQKASLSLDNISGNDVPKNQNKTLSQLIKKRMESLSDVNDGAQEAAKSIAPENLSTDSKSNDATVLEIDSLKQKAPWSLSNIFGNDIPENKRQTLSQSTRKEKSISEPFSDKRLLPKFLKKLFGEKVENNEYEKNCSTAPASPKESLRTNLLGNQEKTSLQSSNNKWEPKIASEKIKNNQHNEGYSSVHSRGSSSTNIKIKNLELDKMRGGIPVAASIHIDEVVVKNNSNKAVNCSNFTLKHLEQDKLGELNVVESTNLDRNFENNANKEVNDNTSAITSNNRNLCASNTPKKIVSEQSVEVGYTQHSPGVTLSPKVDNKKKGRGSDVSKDMSSLGMGTNTQTRLWQQTKQLGQNQSGRNFPSAYALLDHKDSDDDWEDDSDFAAFDYPEPDRGVQPVTPQKNIRLDMLEFSEPKNLKCLLVMFLPCSATAEDLVKAFGHCGKIDEVKIIQSKREESRYNYASIIFGTEEAFQKALTKKNLLVCGSELLVKMAFSSNQNLCQDSASRVAENVAVPLAELKNPKCTIMIKGLPHAISFKHLKNALAFFGNVSRFLMGPSNSTIYVEFETDDAKERALMAHWICIGGQQLQIRRVETPRTSVVRISNVSSETWNSKILSVCSSFGRVKRLQRRAQDIVDVHFHHSELVNMLDILDSLNGVFMNQCRWHAQLATVFSHEALQSLWSSDDGREYLHSVIQNLFKVINKNCFNENDVYELAAQYYREEFSGTKQPLIPTARTMC